MKDEIKEILDNIKDTVDGYRKRCNYNQDEVIYDEINYSAKQWYLLLDYITNLRESEAYYYGQYKDYKSRNEKAIEYIKEHIRIDDEYPAYMEMLVEEKNELLSILQAEDYNKVERAYLDDEWIGEDKDVKDKNN